MTFDEKVNGANELHTQDTTASDAEYTRLARGAKLSSPLNRSPSTTLECEQPSTNEFSQSGPKSSSPTIEKPYSVFTRKEKWLIVGMTAIGGIFSPLTANIYFPAIPIIGQAFHKSTEAINLTVTVYMVLQGVSPMVWGPLADRWGRRLIFLACLLILALSCVGLALTPTNAYWLLIVLRCLQAGGSASTIAVGAGIIADVAARHERGGFYGLYNIGPMFGPCVGPVIGGALAQGLGWRAIFWFLCITSACWFLVMLVFFPETLRALVGDGSIPPPVYSRPLVSVIGPASSKHTYERPSPQPVTNPLKLFLQVDVTILLLANGVLYAVFYGVTASISTLFKQVYPFLGETAIGLCFLSIGGGMLFGGIIAGKVLDKEYRRMERKLLREAKEKLEDPESITQVSKDDDNFPIERARFRTMPIYLVIYIVTCAGYGWALQKHVNLACPLILLIIMGYAIVSILNTTQTLIVDLTPTQGSSITACNNLVRCSLGAALVSIIDIIISSVGIGWAYVILAAMCLVVSPPFLLIMYIGPKFRAKRRAKAQKGQI